MVVEVYLISCLARGGEGNDAGRLNEITAVCGDSCGQLEGGGES